MASVNTCLLMPASHNGGWYCGELSDNNKHWRQIFTLKPNAFFDMYTPLVFAVIEITQHLGPTYVIGALSGTWIKRGVWLFALAQFGAVGYAGDLGVAVGNYLGLVALFLCLPLAVLDNETDEYGNNVTTIDLLPTLKWYQELCGLDRRYVIRTLHDPLLWILRGYVQWASLIVGCLTIHCFTIHWGTAVSEYGAKSSLPGEGEGFLGTTTDTNVGWREIFSLRPEYFVDLWSPLIFGALETAQHISPQYTSKTIAGTWVVRAIWMLFMAFFGQYGYAGNLGILVGSFTEFGVCLPCIMLALLDHEYDDATNMNFTTVNVVSVIDQVTNYFRIKSFFPGLTTVHRQKQAPLWPCCCWCCCGGPKSQSTGSIPLLCPGLASVKRRTITKRPYKTEANASEKEGLVVNIY